MRALPASLVVVSVAVAVVAGAGCATLDDSRLVVLKPSAVSKDFRDLDGKGNPFAKKGATHVDHLVTELKAYDAFFQDSAEIKGTVVLADVVLKETDAYIARVKKDGGRKSLGDKGQKEFDKKKDRLETITALLRKVPDRSGDLVKTRQKLSGGAAKTFIGPNAFKLPSVVKGIEASIDDLEAAGKKAPGLAAHAAKTSASLVGLE
jgi:hypothetical protein